TPSPGAVMALPVTEDAKGHPRPGVERIVVELESGDEPGVSAEPLAPGNSGIVARESLLGLHLAGELVTFGAAAGPENDKAPALVAQRDRAPKPGRAHCVRPAPVETGPELGGHAGKV